MTHAYRVAETSLKGTLKKVQAFLGKSFFPMNIKDFQKVKGKDDWGFDLISQVMCPILSQQEAKIQYISE